MKVLVALAAAAAALSCGAEAAPEAVFAYTPAKVGEWAPPAPPSKESPHLDGLVPPPVDESTALLQTSAGAARKLLQDPAAAAAPVTFGKVPHNWFGQGKYVAPAFSVATGKEECDVCGAMVAFAAAATEVTKGAGPAPATPPAAGAPVPKLNMCESVGPDFKAMCQGYAPYLESCPSFVHDICHEDLGGTERLRSPCPTHLKCYYCLRINPLYCLGGH